MSKALDLVFAGSSDFAVPSLQRLAADGHRLRAVLTQPDRPAGRKRRLTPTPVRVAAESLGIPVRTPETLRDQAVQEALEDLSPDALVVVDYGLILPEAVLRIPRLGCINGHASLLPRWRGAAPIEHAILAGDQTTGITVMAMERGLDTGPVYATRVVDLRGDETAGALRGRLAKDCAEVLSDALPGIASGRLSARPQPEEGVVYAAKLTTADARLDWNETAATLARRVRAFNPRPGAHTVLAGERVKVLEAAAIPADVGDAAPGLVVRTGPEGIDVATAEGILRILRLQLPGRRAVAARDFINANDPVGQTLGQNV